MTCIVAIIDQKSKTAIMGGDSAASSGNSKFIRKDPKVFENGEFIFGCTDSFRMIQLLRYSLKIPEIKDKDIFEFMCTDFIESVRKCFKEGGFLTTDKDEEIGGTFLVIYKDKLFKIDNDFQVAEYLDNVDAIGCGSDFALGALHALKDISIQPSEKIIKALTASEYYSLGVCKPFILITKSF